MKKSSKKTPRIPSYRIHKASQRAYVEIDKHRQYLGPAADPATKQKYHRVIAEWMAAGCHAPAPPVEITVSEVAAKYIDYARGYYKRPDGTPTHEFTQTCIVVRDLAGLYGPTPAQDFGPLKLRALRETWIARNLARKTVNSYTATVKRLFKWASGREIVSPSIWHGLQCVEGLRRGRSNARDTKPVEPVPLDHVKAVKPLVSRQIAALIDLQLLTGARPGELVGLRPCDIDTSGQVWEVRLPEHKTAYLGRKRILHFGPKAQAILREFMLRPPDKPLFSPSDAEKERYQQCTTHRHQSTVAATTKRTLRGQYDTHSYCRAIAYACCKAGIEKWHPHQLRHNAATEVRKQFGLDAAQALLGHAGAAITELYAEIDSNKARAIVAQIG